VRTSLVEMILVVPINFVAKNLLSPEVSILEGSSQVRIEKKNWEIGIALH